MDWEQKKSERLKAAWVERERLLALSEAEAAALPTPIWYQRMRYQREIEAAAWLEDIKRKLPQPPMAQATMTKGWAKGKTKLTFKGD